MADAKGIRAGKAFVEVFADDSKLVRGLKSAQKKLAAFGAGVRSVGTKMMGIGAMVTAPLALAAKNAADSGAELYDMSRRTGLAVESLSMLSYAADQSGTNLETVEGAVRRMQKSIAGVADEMEGTTGKLDELGISAEQIAGKRPEEQFAVIAAAISSIQDPSERAAAAMKVFGKSGTALLPMIEDFERLSGDAKKFGLIKSTGAAKQAKEFTEAMVLMKKIVTSAWNAIGSAVMPILRAKTPRKLSGDLRRVAPNLRRAGLDVQFDRGTGKARKRLVHLAKLDGRTEKASEGTENRPTPNSLFDPTLGKAADGTDGSARRLEDLDADERFEWEERVAICVEAGVPDAEAEEVAWQQIESKRRARPMEGRENE